MLLLFGQNKSTTKQYMAAVRRTIHSKKLLKDMETGCVELSTVKRNPFNNENSLLNGSFFMKGFELAFDLFFDGY